jgi:hypothetical protein
MRVPFVGTAFEYCIQTHFLHAQVPCRAIPNVRRFIACSLRLIKKCATAQQLDPNINNRNVNRHISPLKKRVRFVALRAQRGVMKLHRTRSSDGLASQPDLHRFSLLRR